MKPLDLTGRRFGRLTALRYAVELGKPRRWICRCDCGQETIAFLSNLTREHTLSCGCLKKEKQGTANRTHGMTSTPTWQSWNCMTRRCTDPRRPAYPYYGGRGVAVCERWLRFDNFLADMGERPPGTTLDRYPDNDGNYEPGNCRWGTPTEQSNNRRQRTGHKTHCIRGHELPPVGTSRKCLRCHAMYERERRQRASRNA